MHSQNFPLEKIKKQMTYFEVAFNFHIDFYEASGNSSILKNCLLNRKSI